MSEVVRDVVTGGLILVGAVLCLAAGVGLLRFPDVLARLHAATKPQILGLLAIAVNIVVNSPSVLVATAAAAIVVFQALTAPMSAHLVARAAYETGQTTSKYLVVDDLRPTTRRRRKR